MGFGYPKPDHAWAPASSPSTKSRDRKFFRMPTRRTVAAPSRDDDGLPLPGEIDFGFIAALEFSPQAGPRARDRSAQSRAKIVAVARALFLKHGYRGVSTHEIAGEAGVTQSLIAYHFRSKEGVWQAAMDSLFASFRNGLAERLYELKGAPELQVITQFIAYISKTLASTPAILRIMTDAGLVSEDLRNWLIDRHVRPTYKVAHHLFDVGQRKGILRDHPFPNLYYLLFAAGSVFSLKDEIALVTGQDAGSPAFEAAHQRCLYSMLLSDDALAVMAGRHDHG